MLHYFFFSPRLTDLTVSALSLCVSDAAAKLIAVFAADVVAKQLAIWCTYDASLSHDSPSTERDTY